MRRVLAFAALAVSAVVCAPVGASAATAGCPDAPLRPTQEGVYPPGCYVYEKVSPADKGNGEVAGGNLTMGFRASISGDTVVYGSDGLFAGVPFTTGFVPYVARREPGGWVTDPPAATLPYEVPPDFLVNPGLAPRNIDPPGVSADGTKALVASNIDPATGDLVPNRIYFFDLRTNAYVRIGGAPLAGDPAIELDPATGAVVGTDDFGVVYFSTMAQLTPDAVAPAVPANRIKLYRYADGQLELASFTPDGDPSPGEPAAARSTPVAPNEVSADGGVYWFYPALPGGDLPLYRGTTGASKSVLVNESENTVATVPPGRADFFGADRHGERAVFRSLSALVDDLNGADPGANLFLYTHSADPEHDTNLTLVSHDQEPADGTGANVDVVGGVSDDARTVYFTTDGAQLVPGAPVGPGYKLYRWHDGHLDYLAAARLYESRDEFAANGTGDFSNTDVSADGRYLMFVSDTPGITGDDLAGTRQQFLYDAADGSFTCTSCRPDGPSTASASTGSRLNVLQLGSARRRWLLDDGRVFFQTAERLVPRDTNGKQDVYTWKDGDLKLISSGRSTDDSRFADASADGSTVFFATREQLSGWDTDKLVDLYAARLDGGWPEPVARPDVTCRGDACQPQGPAPVLAAPGSVGFVAPFAPAPRLAAAPKGEDEEVSVKRPKTVRGKTKVQLSVKAPDAGRIRVSGSGLKRAKKTAKKAKTYRVTVKLSKRSKRILRRKHRVKVRATVRFTPKHGKRSRVRVHVTFKTKKHHSKGSRRSHDRGHRSAGKGGR